VRARKSAAEGAAAVDAAVAAAVLMAAHPPAANSLEIDTFTQPKRYVTLLTAPFNREA
jgi:hypothetical protein